MPERWASGPAVSHHLLGRPELCMFFSASIAQEISSPKLAGSERGLLRLSTPAPPPLLAGYSQQLPAKERCPRSEQQPGQGSLMLFPTAAETRSLSKDDRAYKADRLVGWTYSLHQRLGHNTEMSKPVIPRGQSWPPGHPFLGEIQTPTLSKAPLDTRPVPGCPCSTSATFCIQPCGTRSTDAAMTWGCSSRRGQPSLTLAQPRLKP